MNHPAVDLEKLRRDRLAKVQSAMARQGIGSLLLTNPIQIRYATGTTCMTLWTAVNLARYAIVPAHGEPALFEYGKALFLARALFPSARPARYWQYRFSQHEAVEASRAWAKEIKGQLLEWGVFDAPMGIDVLDFYGFEALRAEGLHLTDADQPLEEAKLIKTPDEIALLEHACAIGDAAVHAMERAISPGVTENQLYARYWESLLSLGGEYCSTRLLCSGERTNPWFQEAGSRIVRPGDLVGIDTDMTGPEGYLCDISRTFLCGDRPTDAQREAYHVAHDFISGLIEQCRPGVEYRALIERAPAIPESYRKLGYSCMVHGSGFDDEPPFLPFAHEAAAGALVPEGELAESMVLSVEFYAGKEGGRDGVKLEEQIVLTASGPRLMSRYPFDERLLAR